MQLLKQIWNERRSNGWLWSELLIVFVVLWYVVDWTYVTARTYYEPVGFDITDTYYLELSLKNDKSNSYLSKEQEYIFRTRYYRVDQSSPEIAGSGGRFNIQ